MKIYVAAPWAARNIAAEVSIALVDAGHEVTSHWIQSTSSIEEPGNQGPSLATEIEDVEVAARRDLLDIDRADAYLGLTSSYCRDLLPDVPEQWLHSGGRHVEFGYAVAKDKIVAIIGEPENIFTRALSYQFVDVDHFLSFENFG